MPIVEELKMDLVNRYVAGAVRLLALVEHLPEYQLDWHIEADSWSIREIIHHVTDGLDVWSAIIKKGICTDGILVHFDEFPGNNAWAETMRYTHREIGTSLALIRAHAEYMASLLSSFPDSWDNCFSFITPAGENVATWSIEKTLVSLSEHFEAHAEQIELILAAKPA